MSVSCPICQRETQREWGRSGGYVLYVCGGCTHVFADVGRVDYDKMDQDSFRSHMTCDSMRDDRAYYEHLKKAEAPGRHTQRTVQTILQGIDGVPAGSWLDIGCGSGYLVQQAGEQRWEAVGIEPGGWGQIAAQERGLRVVQGLLREDTFDRRFDVVSATDVIEHQPDPFLIMHLVKRYLNPGGRAFISVPAADCVHARWFKTRWAMVTPPTHCHFFTRASFELLAEKTGMRVEGVSRLNTSSLPLGWRLEFLNRFIGPLLDASGMGDQAIFTLRLSNP